MSGANMTDEIRPHPHNGGYSQEDGDDEERVTLVDDEGHEHDFTLVDVVEIEKSRYAVLLPEEDPEEGAYVFRLETDDRGEEVLVNVDDDSEFDRVVKALEEQEALEFGADTHTGDEADEEGYDDAAEDEDLDDDVDDDDSIPSEGEKGGRS